MGRPAPGRAVRRTGREEEGKILATNPLLVALAMFRNDEINTAAGVLFAFIFSSGTASGLKIRTADTARRAGYGGCAGRGSAGPCGRREKQGSCEMQWKEAGIRKNPAGDPPGHLVCFVTIQFGSPVLPGGRNRWCWLHTSASQLLATLTFIKRIEEDKQSPEWGVGVLAFSAVKCLCDRKGQWSMLDV